MKDLICCLALIALILPPSPLVRQSAAKEAAGARTDLRASATLAELVRLLEEGRQREDRAIELQKLEVAVDYLSYRYRRIETKEQELRELKKSLRIKEDIVARIESDPQAWAGIFPPAPMRAQLSTSLDETPEDMRLKLFKMRIEQMESEILALEAEIDSLVQDLAGLEDYVRRGLKTLR